MAGVVVENLEKRFGLKDNPGSEGRVTHRLDSVLFRERTDLWKTEQALCIRFGLACETGQNRQAGAQ